MRLAIILLLIFIASCSNQDLKLLQRDLDKIRITPSISNEYIGFSNLYEIRKDENISRLWVYEKYIVIERIIDDHIAGFDVYKYDHSKEYNYYINSANPILSKRGPYWPIGIYDDSIMIDIGTGPSVRSLEIINLRKNELIFSGVWNGKNIEILSPEIILVYEFYNEAFPNDEKGWTVRNILHAYSLDLKTNRKEKLNKQIEIITN